MDNQLDRRGFLKKGTLVGLGSAVASMANSGCSNQLKPDMKTALTGHKSMIGVGSTPKDVIKVGFVGIGNMGSVHLKQLVDIEGAEVVAVCDIRPGKAEWARKYIVSKGGAEPAVYTKGDMDFVRMCEEQDLDLVYNAAPWRWHTPICLAAMKNGKHAASEVNIALTIEDCWKLVDASEKYQKHCIMQENCCYDREEMVALNMIQKGIFGEMLHGECGYLHDLRGLNLSPNGYQGMWRLYQYVSRDGNLYPTHGIGPMAWCMNINRGDTFDYMVSVSSQSRGLNLYAQKHYPNSKWVNQKYAKGDVNTCVIKTKKGKSIICKHDCSTPRPYSRDFLVQGTKGIMRKYPEKKIHIEGRSKAHSWEELKNYVKEYDHPIWKDVQEKIAAGLQTRGHGGMDYLEDNRLIQALRKGIAPDIDVYDSVLWSSIIPISGMSTASNGKSIKFPDFTRGAWKKPRPLGVDRIL